MIFELFSQRNAPKKDIDVYEYENFPEEFRNQVYYILSDFIGRYKSNIDLSPRKIYEEIYENFIRQKGWKRLIRSNGSYTIFQEIESYITCSNTTDFIDFIELIFCYIDKYLRTQSFFKGRETLFSQESYLADQAINELNYRFRQYGLGYEFDDGQIVKKSNEFIHQKIVKPSLSLLHDKRFKGAEEEFLKAFESYQNGNNKDAILNAHKAFESTMKCICKEKKIKYKEDDPSKILIKHLIESNFIHQYQENYLNNLEQVLSSGLPTLRNKEASHGQGDKIKIVENSLVEYAINLSAANIVYLVSLLNKK